MDTFIIISSDKLVSKSKKIWGDGSWIPPEEREALDWFMLARIMGWRAKIISNEETYADISNSDVIKWIVVACDPDELSRQTQDWLRQIISLEAILIIVRCGSYKAEWLERLGITFLDDLVVGKRIKRIQFNEGNCINDLETDLQSRSLGITGDIEPLLNLNGHVVVGKSIFKESRIISFGFHPGVAMENNPEMTSVIKDLLTNHTPSTIAWIDWKDTMVLRMDDPGSSELVHHNIYSDCKKLNTKDWSDLGDELKKHKAKLSIGYVNGWVDDGDESRGQLKINGQLIHRQAGAVYPSQEVIYESKVNGLCDYQAEYDAIKKLKYKKLVQVEAHGYTHISPNLNEWLSASTKHDEKKWFREFGSSASKYLASNPLHEHPLAKSKQALSKYWDDEPMVLIYPGEEYTLSAQKDALNFGWTMISSYYQAFKIDQRLCWTQHICSPYINSYSSKWIKSELPFVGYFHDFDIARNDPGWFSDCIENWKKIGIKNFIDLRTLSVGLNYNLSIKIENGRMLLQLNNELISMSEYRYRIKVKSVGVSLPEELLVHQEDIVKTANISNVINNIGEFELPNTF